MAFLPLMLLWAGVTALQTLLSRPRAPRPIPVAPEAFGGITSEEGRPVPVIFGTRQLKNSNVVWFRDPPPAPVAIVQGGVTTGYKYYLGAQYAICTGPIDEVVAVNWNEKPVGASITAATNSMIIGIAPPPYQTATIPIGNYADGEALALAVELAMKAATPGNWKVTFGFRIVAGRNNRIVWGLKYSGVYRKRSANLAAGWYTAAGLATAIQTAMNAAEVDAAPFEIPNDPGVFTVAYSSSMFQMSFSAGAGGGFGYESWALFGADDATFSYATTINSTIGYRMDVSRTGVATIAPDFAVIVSRFIIAYGGTNGKLKLTDAGFTAAALLGLSTALDVDLLSKTSDSDFSIIEATFTETTDYTQIDINDADFFGTEGGVTGRLDIYRGSLAQVASSFLTTAWGTTAPAFPGICYAVQRDMYVGNTNYPKPIAYTLRRCPNQLGLTLERHNIAGDANPACILWEVLTDTRWGLGLPSGQISQSVFQAVGNTLAAEGLGLSLILDAVTAASDFVEEVLRHIDGVLYVDHLTGLISLRLVRNDYVLGSLPVITVKNCDSCRLTRPSWEESRNAIRVHFIDRAMGFTERVFQLHDLANIQARGGDMATEDLQFPGISSQANAGVVAARELKSLSQLPAHVELEGVNREMWTLRPGAPFLLSWAPLGITQMPCRVANVSAGSLEAGAMRIDAVQDVGGSPWTGFIQPTEPAPDPEEPVPIIEEGPLEDSVIFGGGGPLPGQP